MPTTECQVCGHKGKSKWVREVLGVMCCFDCFRESFKIKLPAELASTETEPGDDQG